MKIIEIQIRENFTNMTRDYVITLFGFIRVKKVLYQEQVVFNNLPFWFKASKWLLQKTCNHKWRKIGNPKMEGWFLGDAPSTMIQKIECEICKTESSYKFKWGVDTSF